MSFREKRLKFCVAEPIRNGIGEPAEHDNPEWPRYIRITDIAGPRRLRSDTFRSMPPGVARHATLAPGDLLLAAVGATFGKGLLFQESAPACYAGYLVRVRASVGFRPEFLAYWAESQHYWDQVNSRVIQTTIQNFSASKFADLSVPAPSLEEQRSIADFLDRKTAATDAFIRKQDRLVELLRERRQVLVDGISNGQVGPEVKLGYFADLVPGFAFPSDGFRTEGLRLLRGVNVGVGELRWEDVVAWDPAEAGAHDRFALREGDIVFGMDRPWIGAGLRAAMIGPTDVPSLLLQRVARLRARRGLLQGFLLLLLNSTAFRAYFEPILTGVSVPHISGDQILGFRFRLPSVTDQEHWVALAEEATGVQNDLEKLGAQKVRLLSEYRMALITEAVTGRSSGSIELVGEAAAHG